MTLFNNKYRIESARLKGWDYSNSGIYFITINTYNKKKFFGEITKGKMILNDAGKIVDEEWRNTAILRNNIILDEYVVMPNHFHGIIAIGEINDITKPETCQWHVFTEAKLIGNSLGSIINQFKGKCTKRIYNINAAFRWQSRFHDRIIRDEKELDNIRAYIYYNPVKWDKDEFYIV